MNNVLAGLRIKDCWEFECPECTHNTYINRSAGVQFKQGKIQTITCYCCGNPATNNEATITPQYNRVSIHD